MPGYTQVEARKKLKQTTKETVLKGLSRNFYSEEQAALVSEVIQSNQRFARIKRKFDWHFVKDSAIVGLGSTIARVLGLIFQIVLSWFLVKDDYGFVRSSIALVGILTIVSAASPATLARFLAANPDNRETRDRYFSNAVVGIGGLLVLTLIASIPILLISKALDIGNLVSVVGLTCFFCYVALARGTSNALKMGLGYILTNTGLIVGLLVIMGLLHIRTATVALTIYGLANLLPLLIIEALKPTKVSFRLGLVSKQVLWELAKFSWPLVVANGAYTLWFSTDQLFVQGFVPQASGDYGAAKTLSQAFIFIPTAIALVLMPKVASMSRSKSKRYGLAAVLVAFGLSLVGVIIVALGGHLIISLTYRAGYKDAYLPLLILSIGMTLYSVYLVLEGFLVGLGRPGLHAKAMTVAMVSAIGLSFWLTPQLGTLGASLAFTTGAAIGLVILLFNTWRFLSQDKKVEEIEATLAAITGH